MFKDRASGLAQRDLRLEPCISYSSFEIYLMYKKILFSNISVGISGELLLICFKKMEVQWVTYEKRSLAANSKILAVNLDVSWEF